MTYTDTKINSFIINNISQKQFNELSTPSENELYLTPDETISLPIGTIIPVNATKDYVPLGCLSCDGAEYSKEQFSDLWDNYLTPAYTFDPSGFTVVGSTNITNDGVASGFEGVNYLKSTALSSITPSSSWQVVVKFNLKTINHSSTRIILGKEEFFRIGVNPSNQFQMLYVTSNTTWGNSVIVSSDVVEKNKDYWLRASYNGSVIKLEYSTDGVNYTLIGEKTESSGINSIDNVYIGGCNDANKYGAMGSLFEGSIDLKELSFVVNNETVLSGKTKNAEYFVNDSLPILGSPIISKGLMTGFSGSNYIQFSFDDLIALNQGIVLKFKLPTSITSTFETLTEGITLNADGNISYQTSIAMTSTLNVGFGNYLWVKYISYMVNDSESYLYSMSVSNDGINFTDSNDIKTYHSTLCIGKQNGSDNYYFTGNLDLTESYFFDSNNIKTYFCDVNYLSLLNTCSYDVYQNDLNTYGQCSKFAVKPVEFDKSVFEIVGSPIITTEGFASGFSDSNYIKSNYNLEENKTYNFIIEGVGGVPRTDRGSYIFAVFYGNEVNDNLRVITGKNNGIIRFALGNSSDFTTTSAIEENKQYKIQVTTDFKTFVTFSDLITGYTVTKTVLEITNQVYGENIITYGTARGTSPLTNGSIDLKQFKIEVDGQTVFDGNKGGMFKVPMLTNENTLSKKMVVVANGQFNESKMDWSAWASALQSKLNADHSNDTKVYLKEVSDSSLLPYFYRVYSDGYCIQGNTITTAVTGETTIDFVKEFKNSNYLILKNYAGSDTGTVTARAVSFYNKTTTTATTFNLHVGASWLACGYIK